MIRYRIEYILLKSYLTLLGLLKPQTASAVSGAVFAAIGPLMGITKVGQRNIAMVMPHLTRAQVNAVMRGMWAHLGRIVGEYPHLEEIAKTRTVFLNPEKFDGLQGKAVIFVSGHIGNWEVLPPAILYKQNIAMHSAYRAPNNPLVDTLLVRLRGFGGLLRSFGKTRTGLGEVYRALQNNEAVGMLIDQKMNTGISVPFFHRPAMTSTAFVELARKTGCPLIPGRIIRKADCRFEIDMRDPIPVGDRPTEDVVRDMHGILEDWIRDQPEQWLWIHKRWKKGA